METVNCALCGSADAIQLFDLPDRLFARPQVRATLVQCRRCGLIYQNPRPTLGEMAQHYLPEYELYAPQPTQATLSTGLRLAYDYGMRKRRGFVTRYRRGGRLLDVGCATGLFLHFMRNNGAWDVEGVEINPEAARMARDQFNLAVHTGTLEQAGLPSQAFDVVTMWDVFEHVHDPGQTLDEVWRILKPQGLLILRVPNGSSRDARLFGQYWAGLEPPRHLYVFTPHTLKALFHRNHFELLHYSSASAAYTTFLLSLRFYLCDRDGKLAQRLLRVLYHPAFRLLSAPIFLLASANLRGPLLVATAQKAANHA
jgi:2-polyprenyl-3-methyl-5-hydroxy-6-metoxy-1,4-benzoquinol methylase